MIIRGKSPSPWLFIGLNSFLEFMILFREKIFIDSLLNHKSLSYHHNCFMPIRINTQNDNHEHSPFSSPAEDRVIDPWTLLADLKKNHHAHGRAKAMLPTSFFKGDWAWHQYACRPIPIRPGVSVMAEFDLKFLHTPAKVLIMFCSSLRFYLLQSPFLSLPSLIGFTFAL